MSMWSEPIADWLAREETAAALAAHHPEACYFTMKATRDERMEHYRTRRPRCRGFEVTITNQRAMLLMDVLNELEDAYAKHGRDLWGRHEWYGITAEELQEAFEAIMANDSWEELRHEILQIAAVCIRYLETGDRYGWEHRHDEKATVAPA